jgi:hypothetical protein
MTLWSVCASVSGRKGSKFFVRRQTKKNYWVQGMSQSADLCSDGKSLVFREQQISGAGFNHG